MQELLLKMGGGVYAEGGVFAGFYGTAIIPPVHAQNVKTLTNNNIIQSVNILHSDGTAELVDLQSTAAQVTC